MKKPFKKPFKFVISSLVFSGILYVIFLLTSYNSRIVNELHFITNYDIVSAKHEYAPTIITLDVPRQLYAGDALCFRTVHQEAFVYQNNELKYTYTKDFSDIWGTSAVSSWHIVTLNPYNTEPIQIELYSPFPGLFEYKNFVAIGNSTKLLEYITIQTAPPIFISVASIIIGSACLLWLSYRKYARLFYRLLLFSLFLIVTGIWSLGECRRIFFILIPPHVDRFIYLLAFYLMPFLFFFFISTFNKGIKKNLFIFLSTASLMLIGMTLILQLFKLRDLIQNVYINLVLIVIGVIILLVTKAHSFFVSKNRRINKTHAALGLLGIFFLFEIYNFLNGNFGNFYFYIRCILVLGALYAVVHFITSINYQGSKLVRVQKKLDLAKINVAALKIRPHFMHNTLLSIQELCYANPTEAVDAIGAFSKYLRSSFEISTSQDTLIPFKQEIAHIREYIDVTKICYGEEIVYFEDIAFSDFQIPPFTLQPLVENAIRHGIRKRVGLGTITLKVVFDGYTVTLLVKDDGVGFDTRSIQYASLKTSTGGVMYRLKNLLNATVYVESKKNRGTTWMIQFSVLGEKLQ